MREYKTPDKCSSCSFILDEVSHIDSPLGDALKLKKLAVLLCQSLEGLTCSRLACF